jgi:alpha-beta hydrolase superfamily lysophospholipase
MIMNNLPGKVTTLKLKANKFGENKATLYEHPFQGKSNKSVLYLHGFNDYFFQEHMADWFTALKIKFFALDLRRYGRSLMSHQKPNNTHNLREYDEEITMALDQIQGMGNEIVLLGHSTGGLIAALYCHHYRQDLKVKALILNSPFFDFNMSPLSKLMLPIVAFVGKLFPFLPSPAGLNKGYGKSVHRLHHGEWDFDTKIKPIEGYAVDLGWINAIYSAQKELQKGLNIPVPILVMHSDKSIQPGDFTENMLTADSVLNIEDIAIYSEKLGKMVSRISIENGMHDLMLSQTKARQKAFNAMKDLLKVQAGFI